MKGLFCAVCCLSVASLPSLAQSRHRAKGAMTDQQFVDMAGQTDMVEANLGELSQTASSSQQVKDFGQTLRTEHTADYQQLQTAAQQASLTVPTAIDSAHYRTLIAPLARLKGAAFDRRFAREMVTGHTKAIAVYKKEADDAQNASIKTYAQAAEPVLEEHLAAAKDLEKPKAARK